MGTLTGVAASHSFVTARMPKHRSVACDSHIDGECQCYKNPVPGAQSLEELSFLKSACSAAQQGNLTKLQDILAKRPGAVNSDGIEGRSGRLWSLYALRESCTFDLATAGISGYTPLHYAARGGHLDVTNFLLIKGGK